MKTFCLGDPHGALKAIKQCFERSGFNKNEDRLIVLGDVADGWSEVYESVEELMTVKNLIYIIGNHDDWLINWLKTGDKPTIWTQQGGQASIDSYKRNALVYSNHITFFRNGVYYFIDEKNRVFVHGGFNWRHPIEDTMEYDLIWDRDLFRAAYYWDKLMHVKGKLDKVELYDEVFIGHTTTSGFDPTLKPVHVSNVWNLDQGAGWEGKLTIMNVENKNYWQSDIVKTLYPNEKGR